MVFAVVQARIHFVVVKTPQKQCSYCLAVIQYILHHYYKSCKHDIKFVESYFNLCDTSFSPS